MPGFAPAVEPLFVSAKVAKTMLAVVWPFGFPAPPGQGKLLR